MSPRPTDGSDEPEAADQVMLAVLANRGKSAASLSAEQERLVDDWVAGRLAPDAAERAETLVKQNALAAERVLERRLLDAARQSPAVPQELAARVLRPAIRREVPAFGGWWRSLGRWQWTGILGAVALASIVAVVGLPVLQQALRGTAPIQVAMATIQDRNILFEASDLRMRGSGAQQAEPSAQRFRDVEVPVGILRNLLTAAGETSRTTASRDIEPYLSASSERDERPIRVVIDQALRNRIQANDGRDRLLVRVYNLEDPRAADIRSTIGGLPDGARTYLLTVKP